MADKKASLILELKDAASAGIAKVTGAMGSLMAAAAGVTAGLAVLFAGMMKSLAAYGEQEQAVSKLNKALENQGIKSEAATRDLVRFADELQNTTVFADDAVIGAMALGATFGLTGERLKATTKAAADMSAALGIDLKTTMLLLGKASVGETSTLSRYGIVIGENVPKAERFAAALSQINARFGGSAAAQAGTYSGQMEILKNKFDDLYERIGEFLLPVAQKWVGWLNKGVEALNNMAASTDKESTASMNMAQKKKAALDEVMRADAKTVDALTRKKEEGWGMLSRRDQQELDAALKRQEQNLKASKRLIDEHGKEIAAKPAIPTGKPPAMVAEEDTKAEERQAKLLIEAQNEIDTAGMTEQQLFEIKTASMAMELEAMGRHDEAVKLTQARRTEYEKKQNEDRAKNLRSTLGTIATLSTNHNKTLAAVGKAAAISTATLDTYAAANKALASAPPPWNFGLAALVTAAGMANVANIAGVKLAEGGMIMPTAGGTSAIMAEAGKAEVAIPLDDDRTKEKLRDVMGGGGNTIVIQAGVVVADDYSLNEFANKLDEKLYERQRNRRSFL